MTTAIAAWGNSNAVRLPQDLLAALGLTAGDKVEISKGANGTIVITPVAKVHRKISPEKNISFSSLFSDYSGGPSRDNTWPTDDYVGAEMDAWA